MSPGPRLLQPPKYLNIRSKRYEICDVWRMMMWSQGLLHFSTASASINIGQLEQQLILLLEPRKIRQTLIELHGMAERSYWRVNNKVRSQQCGTGGVDP